MRKYSKLCWLFAILFCLSTSRAEEADQGGVPLPPNLPPPIFAPPPRLAFTSAELAAYKSAPEYSAIRERTIKAAGALLEKPVLLPEGYGGWIFDYACPDDGSTLRPLSVTEHECPQCKKIYSDEKSIIAYRARLHYEAEEAAETLARAYAFSGDERYATGAKRILLHFARAYPSYPARRDRWGGTGELAVWGGRRFVQSLDEATGIIKLARAYDLTRTAKTWTQDESTLVENDLFGLTAQTLLQFNQDISNHQTWYNAGLMAIASVRGDAELVKKVLSMRGGFYDQMERSVGRDGLWYEGTMAYHGYALQAMKEIVEAGRRMGLKLYETPKFKALLLGPLHAAYPNGQFPAINDSDPIHINGFQHWFAWARELYGDAVNTAVSALSEDLPDAGLAILRSGSGENAVAAFLDYGQHGGGHGHFDKLNLLLFANGREWLLDPGRLTYSHKEYKTWVKETAAHNTVTWNGKSQRPTKGELLWLQTGDGWSACAAQSTRAYPGVVLRRYLFLSAGVLADVFEIEAAEPGQIDWLAHAVVSEISPVDNIGESTPQAPGEGAGYQHFSDGKKWTSKTASRWDFVSDEKKPEAPRLRVWLGGNENEEIFTATGIGYNIGQKAPTLIRRRNGQSTRFVTVYDLSGRGDAVQSVELVAGQAPALSITTPGGTRTVTFSAEGVQTTLKK